MSLHLEISQNPTVLLGWQGVGEGKTGKSARILLKMGYADDRELVMDILRHVPEVEVLEPVELREKVIEKLRAGLAGMAG